MGKSMGPSSVEKRNCIGWLKRDPLFEKLPFFELYDLWPKCDV